ncbi:dual specificity protein kinase Ttk [Synchiropus splendidus]|uniref:dual specificity protein kinase Ttk n=1 Tax=Synchiropus splendidus TaxID=270530 RepID=UPI00237D5650|nr:dual specificity protein kinase Ttk [Synchiropus splendidus]
MEEDEHTDRKRMLAMLHQRLHKIKKSLKEDDTNDLNQIIGSNSPESCRSYLMDLEKRRDPVVDHKHLARVIDHYTRVFSNMPLGKHCENESYARMLVRFAELKAIQDVDEAESNFNVATSHCQNFAFVHIAHAQFEHSQGNTKKGLSILLNAVELGAEPKDLLEGALNKMRVFNLENKENFSVMNESVKNADGGQKVLRTSDSSGDSHVSGFYSSGLESIFGSTDEEPSSSWKSASQRKKTVGLPGRVPVVPFSIPENDDDEDDESLPQMPSNNVEASDPSSLPRQRSGLNMSNVFPTSSKKPAIDKDSGVSLLQSSSSESTDDQYPVESTTKLLHSHWTKDTSVRMEDLTFRFDQVVNAKSPESCWASLLEIEKRGNPHTDGNLLNKLKDCYAKVFSHLPMIQFSKNLSYAKIMVRYAELKGIEDPEEAKDNFIIARTNCKGFAFVHVAHAQFEATHGNVTKANSILLKAQSLNAKPAELLEMALHNLKIGEALLLPSKENPTTELQARPKSRASNLDGQLSCRAPLRQLLEQPPKPVSGEPLSEWKVPAVVKHVSPEVTLPKPHESRPPPRVLEPLTTPSQCRPSRPNPNPIYQTPNSYGNPYGNSSITPVVKVDPAATSSAIAAHRAGSVQQPVPPLQDFFSTLSNDTITINGKQFFILKLIGRGGSSKVYQVLDLHKRLFVVKCVDLEEADAQAIESYKNEIEHLNHLQQYSDQIIKLYDYEITDSYIYMLMECGNLDLNTVLRKKKTVNPLERKIYWRNMLEAVQTIHKHGIVHSDLKPANFVIVNTSLKLIDFGIANRIQPDVTSIIKDSQVGTLNYMPPEAIKDTSSRSGKAVSKISPKGDVWSLGCILYYMTYGKTPFQSITNQITKLHAILDPSHIIDFPDIPDKDLLDVLKRCLVRNPRERVSIAELLEHPYLHLKPPGSPVPEPTCNRDLQRILVDLAALQSPNSIVRAANNLAKMCSSGRRLDVAECAKSTQL